MPTNLQFSHQLDADALSTLKADAVNFALAGDNVIVSGIAGKKIYCYKILLVFGGDTNVTFKDGTGTNLSGALPMKANGSIILDTSNTPWYQTSAGNDFILGSSGSVQVSGTVYYQQN